MKNNTNTIVFKSIVILPLLLILSGCGDRTPSNQSDSTAPVITLISPVGGEETRTGNFLITWNTDDPNPRTVEIKLSSISGSDNFPVTIAEAAADIGSFDWNTTGLPDGLNYRIQITPTDISDNLGNTVTSTADFAINNTPKVRGLALYTDENLNQTPDFGDKIIIPFDRNIKTNSTQSKSFILTAPGNTFGDGAVMSDGPAANEITITLGNNASFKTRQRFDNKFTPNKASGISISPDINTNAITGTGLLSIITAKDSPPVDIWPAYVDSGQTLGSSNSTAITIVDIEHNGSMDMIIANNGQANLVWTNDGSGTFIDSGQTLGTSNSQALATGDVDKNGTLDLVVANNGQANKLWTNDGSGNFTDAAQNMGNSNTLDIALADVDKDGDFDIITGNNGQANLIWLNDNTTPGTFTDSGQSLNSAGNTTAIAVGDVDNDGDLDIVTGNNGQANRVWLNDNGTPGTYNDSLQLLGSSNTTTITLHDVNDDGSLDIIEGNNGQANRIWRNNGSGVFTDSGQSLGNSATTTIDVYDIDSDGKLDIIEGIDGQANVVWVNNGSGVFTDSLQRLGSNNTQSLIISDIDKDGDGDIIEANNNTGANLVWLNSLFGTWGDVNFTKANTVVGDSFSTRSVALGDLNNDGYLDLISGNRANDNITGEPNQVFLNNGNGSGDFTFSQNLGPTPTDIAQTQQIKLFDIDRDGDLDFVSTNNIDLDTSIIWLNDGAGIFTQGQLLVNTISNRISAVNFADINLDGDIDILLGSGLDNLAFNNVANVFTDSTQTLDPLSTREIEVSDVNHDGFVDLINCDFGSGAASGGSVWLNTPINPGIFTDSLQALNGTFDNQCLSLDIADFNGNGSTDIIFGNRTTGVSGVDANRVMLNDGSGVFTQSQTLGNSDTSEVVTGDIDGDGDIDIVAANNDQGNIVWINNGSGIFSADGIPLGANDARSMTIGDIDNDGDLDLIEGIAGQGNNIWLNE